MEPLALSIAAALFVLALLKMPGFTVPAIAFAVPHEAVLPGEDEEELPQTDRAPSPHRWLSWTVLSVAALRLVLLVTLHA